MRGKVEIGINEDKLLLCLLTSSLRHPKIFIK